MSLICLKNVLFAAALAGAPQLLLAQNSTPQPYDPQDPQNYSAPAQAGYRPGPADERQRSAQQPYAQQAGDSNTDAQQQDEALGQEIGRAHV